MGVDPVIEVAGLWELYKTGMGRFPHYGGWRGCLGCRSSGVEACRG